MDYKKPQSTLVQGGTGIYPLTTADQVILADGSRLEKDGRISADSAANSADSAKLGGKSLAEIMLGLYPVGSIYMSVNSTSPASLFGGTWEQLQDRFLLAAGSTYSAGSTGGEAEHTLTIDEIPSHSHDMPNPDWTSGDYVKTWPAWASLYKASQKSSEFSCAPGNTQNTGSSIAHNNMPPYLAVYMWKRVS